VIQNLHYGFCPICEKPVAFHVEGAWLRDQFTCEGCKSVPRERALMQVLKTLYPNWRSLRIHESSPAQRGASVRLASDCAGYVASQFDTSVPFGQKHPQWAYRSEDLEHQTFADASFDLVVTQDVFEHIFRPDLAIKEIARTLKPGGAHIMTTPLVNKEKPSFRRASLVRGDVVHHADPIYHGNPIDKTGSLVTVDWGFDIAAYLTQHSGLPTMLVQIDDIGLGIRADLIEVVVTQKLPAPVL
jgi:SAM-dependent methyltransferase